MPIKKPFVGINKANFSDTGQQKHIDSLAKNISILVGQTNNKDDRAVLYRDLKELGLVSKGGQLSSLNFSSGGGGSGGGGGGGSPSNPTTQTPTQPQNVTVNAAFTTIMIQWDIPTYVGHKHAEIYRNTVDQLGDMLDPRTAGEAVLIATVSGSLYVDSVNFDTGYYYWVRFVNINDEVGAVNSASGTFARTKKDIAVVIAEIDAAFQIEFDAFELAFNNALVLANNAATAADVKAQAALDDISIRIDGALVSINSELDGIDLSLVSANQDIANANLAITDANQLITDANAAAAASLVTVNGLLDGLRTDHDGFQAIVTNDYYNSAGTDLAIAGQITLFRTSYVDLNYVSLAYLGTNVYTIVEADSAITSQVSTAISAIDYGAYATTALLSTDYRTAVTQDLATTTQINTALSTIDNTGLVTLALLTSDYRTAASQDTATTTQISTALSQIDYSGFVTTALLSSDYRTAVTQDTATTSEINTAISSINYSGFATTALLTSDYRTAVTQDTATTSQINTAISTIDYSGFVTTALLTSDYRTAVTQDTATTTEIDTAISQIDYSGFATTALLTSDYRTAVSQDAATTSQINTALSTIDNGGLVTLAFLQSDYRTSVTQDLATTTEINTAISAINYSGFATTAALTSDYRTAVTQDLATTSQINTAISTIDYSGFATTAFIQTDYTTTVNQNIATAAAVQVLRSEVTTAAYATQASVSTNNYTRTEADIAIAGQITTFNTNTLSASYKTTAQINLDHYTITDANSAISTAVDTLEAKVFNPDGTTVSSAFIGQVRISNADLNGAIATGVDNYSVTYNGSVYSISQVTQVSVDADSNYQAQWGIQTTVGALQHGIGFLNNNGVTTFVASVDNFGIYNPVDGAMELAFSVVDGVIVAKKAIIGDLQIQELLVQNQSVFEGNVLVNTRLTAAVIYGARIFAGELFLRGSSNVLSFSPDNTTYAMWYGSRFAFDPTSVGQADNRSDASASFALKHDGTVIARRMTIYNNASQVILDVNGVNGAYIQDLSVDTLAIAGNAISDSAYTEFANISIAAFQVATFPNIAFGSTGISSNVAGAVIAHFVFEITRTSSTGSGGNGATFRVRLRETSTNNILVDETKGTTAPLNETIFVPFTLYTTATTVDNLTVETSVTSGGRSFNVRARVVITSAKR
jgi:hypothetical protein